MRFCILGRGVAASIVASNIPSTREVVPEEGAFWFTGDVEREKRACTHELFRAEEPEKGQCLGALLRGSFTADDPADLARREVARYTWDTRARILLAHL